MWTAAKDRLTKPFDSTKKPWKKPGSGNSDQISHLTEETAKLKKRLKQKSKKHKKRARDLSKTDSDSSQDNGSSSTGRPVDKRLKIDQPSGIHLDSTDTRPIKVTKLALDNIRANEIAIKNSKTCDVSAIVAILNFVVIKLAIHGTLIPGNC